MFPTLFTDKSSNWIIIAVVMEPNQTVTMMSEEEAPEVGPNDIVIHLVNPYKCGQCDLEFLEKTVFKVSLFQLLWYTENVLLMSY